MVGLTQSIARMTLQATRDFYKGQVKSANKAYDIEGKVKYKAGTVKRDTIVLPGSAADIRDRNAALAEDVLGSLRDEMKGKSPLEAGGILFKTRGPRAGNCGEMACVAIHIAHVFGGVPAAKLYLKYVEGKASKFGFSHQFMLMTKLDDDTSQNPPNATGPQHTSWVVDPWANICCRLADFATEFDAQMTHWTRVGKRIHAKKGHAAMWCEPSHACVLASAQQAVSDTGWRRADNAA